MLDVRALGARRSRVLAGKFRMLMWEGYTRTQHTHINMPHEPRMPHVSTQDES